MATQQISENKPSIGETEELLSFAEKVSDRIRSLEDNLSRIRSHVIITLLVAYGAFAGALYTLFDSTRTDGRTITITLSLLVLGLVFVCAGSLFMFINRHRIQRRCRDDLSVEVRVIGDLVQMLSGLIESIREDELGVFPKEMLRMRLRRIKFSERRIT